MKTWLKGGIIGAFFGLLHPIWYFIFYYILPKFITKYWKIILFGWLGWYGIIILTLAFIITFFIIGAIIGLIIQKLRK